MSLYVTTVDIVTDDENGIRAWDEVAALLKTLLAAGTIKDYRFHDLCAKEIPCETAQ